MDQIKQGRIAVHGDLDRFTEDGVVFSNGSQVTLDAVVLATGYRGSIEDLVVGWEAVCDSSGTPTVSGAPTALGGLYFCGMYVSPAGMLREIGIEATRIATHINRQFVLGRSDMGRAPPQRCNRFTRVKLRPAGRSIPDVPQGGHSPGV
jgi:hypothetical protein